MRTILLFVLTSNFVFSQNDSLSEALKYYPLQTGNYWEYRDYYVNIIPYEEDTSFFSIEVKGDTILSNNKQYKVLTRKSIPFDGYITKFYERIDSSTACTYRYSTDPIFPESEFMFDSLLAEPGDTFAGSFEGRSFGGVFQTVCLDEYEDTIWNFVTKFKDFQDQSDIPAINYTLAKGLGFFASFVWELSFFSRTLIYAKIDSAEYGTQLTFIGNDNYNQPDHYILYQNYPNPFNPATNIEYSVPRPDIVTIKVYDVLGNEIRTLMYEEKMSGRYKIQFDGRDLSSGIYFYTLKAGNFIQARKMLLLR